MARYDAFGRNVSSIDTTHLFTLFSLFALLSSNSYLRHHPPLSLTHTQLHKTVLFLRSRTNDKNTLFTARLSHSLCLVSTLGPFPSFYSA